MDSQPDNIEKRRLWIGNLDPRITEFVLLKLLQKHGTLEKFDFLFHRSGPLEGQPRGYVFVTYTTPEFAKAAKENLDGKTIGSKVVSVKWAYKVANESFAQKNKTIPNIPALGGTNNEKKVKKATIIQAIKAKLKTMEDKPFLQLEINERLNTLPSTSQLKPKKMNKSNHKPYIRKKL